MFPHYQDYCWKKGKPEGIHKLTSSQGISYKIISDPYHKRISVERYTKEQYLSTVYDSAMLDFRLLRTPEAQLWEREYISAQEAWIRDHHERVIVQEKYIFENGVCRICSTYSLQGVLLSLQRIYYTIYGNEFNGIELYDAHDHLVMCKKYTLNVQGEFEDVITESWECSNNK